MKQVKHFGMLWDAVQTFMTKTNDDICIDCETDRKIILNEKYEFHMKANDLIKGDKC